VLREQRVTLVERWDAASESSKAPAGDEDPFALQLPTLMLANKAELVADVSAEIQAFRELTRVRYPLLAVSAATGLGLGEIAPWLFGHLGIVRVYTKTPGHLPEKDRPFTLRRGQTIRDVARLVHQDLARSLRYARVWGTSGFDGQQVGHDHAVEDGDVVELHT
jgi:ribosome-interacting GTPase 1